MNLPQRQWCPSNPAVGGDSAMVTGEQHALADLSRLGILKEVALAAYGRSRDVHHPGGIHLI